MPKKLNGYDEHPLPLLGVQYVQKKEAIKELTSQCEALRVPLEAALGKDGKKDSKGNTLLVMEYTDVEVHLKHTLRVSSLLVPEALEILKKARMTSCIKKQVLEVVDEDEIRAAYDSGAIDDKLLAQLYEAKTTKAFSVSLKEKFKE